MWLDWFHFPVCWDCSPGATDNLKLSIYNNKVVNMFICFLSGMEMSYSVCKLQILIFLLVRSEENFSALALEGGSCAIQPLLLNLLGFWEKFMWID